MTDGFIKIHNYMIVGDAELISYLGQISHLPGGSLIQWSMNASAGMNVTVNLTFVESSPVDPAIDGLMNMISSRKDRVLDHAVDTQPEFDYKPHAGIVAYGNITDFIDVTSLGDTKTQYVVSNTANVDKNGNLLPLGGPAPSPWNAKKKKTAVGEVSYSQINYAIPLRRAGAFRKSCSDFHASVLGSSLLYSTDKCDYYKLLIRHPSGFTSGWIDFEESNVAIIMGAEETEEELHSRVFAPLRHAAPKVEPPKSPGERHVRRIKE